MIGGMAMNLAGVIERVRKLAGRVSNEESTKQHLILPVLGALGWDIFNPDEIEPELSTGEGRPDYTLRLDGKAVAFIEAKSTRVPIFKGGRIDPSHARQLTRYCFDRGVELGILTNGLQWALLKAFEPGKSINERVILAVDLMSQETAEAAERLRWLSRGNILNYMDIPLEYSRIPTQVPARTIPVPELQSSRSPAVSSYGDPKFRTLYVSAREVPSLPASAIQVRRLLGTGLKGYQPLGVFVKLNGKWYRVDIAYGENWRGLRLAWSSITAVVVRFLCDRGMCSFPEVGQFITRRYPQNHPEWYAKVGEWYLRGPGNGDQAVKVFYELEKHLGVEIALEITNTR